MYVCVYIYSSHAKIDGQRGILSKKTVMVYWIIYLELKIECKRTNWTTYIYIYCLFTYIYIYILLTFYIYTHIYISNS